MLKPYPMKWRNLAAVAAAVTVLASCQGNKTASNGGDNYTIKGKLNNATAGPI